MDKVERAVDDIRRKWVPDGRLGVFEVSLLPKGVAGVTSSRDARDALRRLAGEQELVEQVRLLPDETVTAAAAIVTAALAPLLDAPQLSAPRVNEALHGESLDVLERRDDWLRVRAPDGYVAWTHAGYVATGAIDWADDWRERATARSLRTAKATKPAICSSLLNAVESLTSRCGPGLGTSCMPRFRVAASPPTICLVMNRA